MLSSTKTDLTTTVKLWSFNSLFRCKSSCESNLIFMHSYPYFPGLSFIFSIRFLISFQSSVYFVNTSLFLSAEAKINYLFSLLSSMYPSNLSKTKKKQKKDKKDLHDLHYEYLDNQDL